MMLILFLETPMTKKSICPDAGRLVICMLAFVALGIANQSSQAAEEQVGCQDKHPPTWKLCADTVNKTYQVTISPELGRAPIGDMHRWIISVRLPNGQPVYPAQISIGGGMQGHGHGLPTQPRVIAYGGEGDYLIDGMRFNMEGEWRLSFVIEAERGIDRVDFDLLIEI
jgi:hypothetical protein